MIAYLYLFALIITFSCSNPDKSIKKSSNDFLAYYNTFYMAEKYFKDALDIIESNQDNTDALSLETKNLLDKAIQNSLIIVSDFYNTQYIDDAYYILGMSSYLKNNITSAKYYFNRILNEYLNSNYFNMSLIMLGNLHLKTNRLNELNELFVQIDNELQLINGEVYYYYLLKAEYFLFKNDIESCKKNYFLALDNTYNKNNKISIYMQLIQLSENEDNYRKAVLYIDKIQDILDIERINDNLFQKWLSYNIKIGSYDIIIKRLNEYIRSPKINQADKIFFEVELSNIYIFKYLYSEARDKLLNLVDEYSDSRYKKDLDKAYYLLGDIYLLYENNFDEAISFYQNCIDLSKNNKYKQISEDRIKSIQNYLKYKEEIFIENNLYNESNLDSDESVDRQSPIIDNNNFSHDIDSNVPAILSNNLDSLIFYSGKILYSDLGMKDSALYKFKFLVDNFLQSKFRHNSLIILDLEEPNDKWQLILKSEYPEYSISDDKLSKIDLMIDEAWDLLSSSENKAVDALLDIYNIYNNDKALYIVGFVYDDYIKDIDKALFYYKKYLNSFEEGEYNVRINDRILELENMIDYNVKYYNQIINLRKGKYWFESQYDIDSSLYYIKLGTTGIDNSLKIYCNNIAESLKNYSKNDSLFKINLTNKDSMKLILANILYKELSYDDLASKYYKEIIVNNKNQDNINDSYAALSLFNNEQNWDSLLYVNLNDTSLYQIYKNNAQRKFEYKFINNEKSNIDDYEWFKSIYNKHFPIIEENNLEIE